MSNKPPTSDIVGMLFALFAIMLAFGLLIASIFIPIKSGAPGVAGPSGNQGAAGGDDKGPMGPTGLTGPTGGMGATGYPGEVSIDVNNSPYVIGTATTVNTSATTYQIGNIDAGKATYYTFTAGNDQNIYFPTGLTFGTSYGLIKQDGNNLNITTQGYASPSNAFRIDRGYDNLAFVTDSIYNNSAVLDTLDAQNFNTQPISYYLMPDNSTVGQYENFYSRPALPIIH